MLATKGMLERVIKESQEKEAYIKLQEERIASFDQKAGEAASLILAKTSESEEEERTSVQSETSDKEVHSKKGSKLKNGRSPSLMIIEQIQDLIVNVVKAQLEGGTCKTHLYTKPYTKRVDELCMPCGYQPQKFEQFDGKGNLKQHVTHFIETCDNAGADGDLMVKQFVRTLKGIAFDWYTDLELASIGCWGKMK